jgi:hypothetical protein
MIGDKDLPYKVVQVPTALGIVSGLFQGKILSEWVHKEDAEYSAYLHWVDEPSPDKRNYYKLEVVYYDK